MTSSNENIFRVTGPLCAEFTGHRQRPVTRRFDIFFHLRLNKWLSKQSWGLWFDTPSRSLWRHCNVLTTFPNAFPWKKSFASWFKSYWSLHPLVQLTLTGPGNGLVPNIHQALNQYQWWPSSITQMCVTRPQYVMTTSFHHSEFGFNSYLCYMLQSCIICMKCSPRSAFSWWRHQTETFSALLAICAGNSPVTGEFPAQRPVTRSFDVFFDLLLNKLLSKQS